MLSSPPPLAYCSRNWAGAPFDYARLASAAVSSPSPLDYSEGHKLDQVLRLAQLENIYRNSFAAAPYTVSTGPPLFQLIQAPLATLFGPAIWYGRLISILSAIGAAALLGLILHALTVDGVAAAVGAEPGRALGPRARSRGSATRPASPVGLGAAVDGSDVYTPKRCAGRLS